ncbi:MAG: DUF481 domain-containing protein [Bacteroidetes bacterium]|nr:DUF481 domain-containing protein [Bacteroidota bacterium]
MAEVNSQVVNIENKRIYDDTTGWSGIINGQFNIVQVNKTLYTIGLRPLVQYKNKKSNIFLLGDLSYVASNQETFSNQGMLHVRYAYRIKSSTWKIETYSQTQYNEFLDQQYRVLIGTGIRDKFFDKNGFKFFVGSSILLERTRLISDSTNLDFARWSNYLSWLIQPNNALTITGSTYFQPVINQFDIYNLSGQYVLKVRAIKNIDIKLEYNHYYDSRNQNDYLPFQQSLLFGFSINLK